jgi:hypothetical protein
VTRVEQVKPARTKAVAEPDNMPLQAWAEFPLPEDARALPFRAAEARVVVPEATRMVKAALGQKQGRAATRGQRP